MCVGEKRILTIPSSLGYGEYSVCGATAMATVCAPPPYTAFVIR